MEAFFKKFPVKLSESIALSMMHDKMELAMEKHEEKEESHMKELYVLHQMIETFLNEKGYSPSAG